MSKSKFIFLVILFAISGGMLGWYFSGQELSIDISEIFGLGLAFSLGWGTVNLIKTKVEGRPIVLKHIIFIYLLSFAAASLLYFLGSLWAIFSQGVGAILGMVSCAIVGIIAGLYDLKKDNLKKNEVGELI